MIVGYHFLEWVYRNPSLIVGTLFENQSTGPSLCSDAYFSRTIGLLLGVTAKDVKSQHRAALLTFEHWVLMEIVEDGRENGLHDNEIGTNEVSFSMRLLNATMNIVKRPSEGKKEPPCQAPPISHTLPKSPSSTSLPKIATKFSRISSSTKPMNSNLYPTFRIWPDECDTVCINALQKKILILLSHCLSQSTDEVECYFICIEKKIKSTCTDVGSYCKNIVGASVQEIASDEVKKRVIKLESKIFADNLIEATITPKDFANLSTFLSVGDSAKNNDNSKKIVAFELKLNGTSMQSTKSPSDEFRIHTRGTEVNIESPISTLERLMETSAFQTANQCKPNNICTILESMDITSMARSVTGSVCKRDSSKISSGTEIYCKSYKYDHQNQNSQDNANMVTPPFSGISPPPTPPAVPKIFHRNNGDRYNRRSLQSSPSGESCNTSSNMFLADFSRTLETVNNDLYDIPRRLYQPNSSDLYSFQSLKTSAQLITENQDSPLVTTELISNFESSNPEDRDSLDMATRIDKDRTTVPCRPIEHSYIPMQPRCNSLGNSSYPISAHNTNSSNESDSDYNSMRRRKKSSSTSCISPLNCKNSLSTEDNQIAGESNNSKDPDNLNNSGDTPISNEKFLGVRSSPKPRHEFMKTFCNFSNQEAVLSDDYSPYKDKFDAQSLNSNLTLNKLAADNAKSNEVTSTTPDKEKLSSSIVVGFTPTFISKFKKPIEKSESLVWPPKISKRKTTKKVRSTYIDS